MTIIDTKAIPTWCPGCFNFQILAGVKKVLNEIIKTEEDRKKWMMVSGIGCSGKIMDYINLNGVHTLHGRVLPTCMGMKIGNPNLNVLGFSGDGDAYAEGGGHLVHAARYNADFKYFVHNNQVFALTVGQSTPVTNLGFRDKTNPEGVKLQPINPIKIMLAAGASFVARVFADVSQVEWITREALKHKGFAFIEVIQPCIVFHPDKGYKEKTYMLQEAGHDKTDYNAAWKKANEFDYNTIEKIPIGIFYQVERPSFDEHFEVLHNLKTKGIGFRDVKR